jgi:DNA-binding CsgD family transcriptional regulator
MKARYLLILLSMIVSSVHAQRTAPVRRPLEGGPETILKSKDQTAAALGVGYRRPHSTKTSFFTGYRNRSTHNTDLSPQISLAERVSIRSNLSTGSFATENLPERKLNALRNLISLYEESGNYAGALKYQKEYDSLKYFTAANEWVRIQNLAATSDGQEQNKMQEAVQKRERTRGYLLLAVIVLLAVPGIFLYRRQKIRTRKDRMLHASREALIEGQLKDARFHEMQLRNEIEKKNDELSAYALHSIQKNQLLEQLKNKIRRIREDADGRTSPELGKMLHKISNTLNLDENWNDFSLYFEQAHHPFFQQLKMQFGELTHKELRLCALLKLHLSSKEMASILGISAESVKMARYRMRKKLHLNSQTDLGSFMLDFEKRIS